MAALVGFEVPYDTSGNFKAKCKHCSSPLSGSLRASSIFFNTLKGIFFPLSIEGMEYGGRGRGWGEGGVTFIFI